MVEGLQLGGLRFSSLLADDVVLLASLGCGFTLTLELIAAECEAASVRINTSMFGPSLVLIQKRTRCAVSGGACVFQGLAHE